MLMKFHNNFNIIFVNIYIIYNIKYMFIICKKKMCKKTCILINNNN